MTTTSTTGTTTKKKKKDDGMLFKSGDYVVYPTHGVGLVKGIENQTVAGLSL